MFRPEYQYLVRAEQYKDLIRKAAHERLWNSIRPLRTSKERIGQRLIRQTRAWLDRQSGTLPCHEALPACGLISAA